MGTIIGAAYYQLKYYFRRRLRTAAPESDWIYRHYVHRKFYDTESLNRLTAELIHSGKPFMMGRFGAVELFNMRTAEFHLDSKQEKAANSFPPAPVFSPQIPPCSLVLMR